MKKRENNIIWKSLLAVQRAMIITTSAAVTLIIFWAAASRIVNISFAGFEELSVIAAFWLYMLGSAYGSYEKSQISADILTVMMKDGLRKSIIQLLKCLLTLILGLIFLRWGWGLFMFHYTMGSRTPVYRLPAAIGHASIFVGLALSSFYHAVYLYDEVKRFIAIHIKKQAPASTEGEEKSAK